MGWKLTWPHILNLWIRKLNTHVVSHLGTVLEWGSDKSFNYHFLQDYALSFYCPGLAMSVIVCTVSSILTTTTKKKVVRNRSFYL